MSVLNVEKAVASVPGDDPCGPRFTDEIPVMMLLEKAKGIPEAVMGDSVRPAEEPNWGEVRDEAMALLGQTKDLWLGMLLALAGLRLGGLPGFSEGLSVVERLLADYWEGLHPRPDEDGDAYERIGAISALAAPASSFGDDWRFVERIREAPLTDSRQIGRFSLRHLAMAAGELGPRGEEQIPTPDLIEAAFSDTDAEPLQGLLLAAAEAIESLDTIRTLFEAGVGSMNAPDFSPVRAALEEVRSVLAKHLEQRGYGSDSGGEASAGGAESGSRAGSAPAESGSIQSAADVTRQLDRIIDYYVRTEPSSPVPLLLRRAQRLVSRSFMDIVRDLSPDALAQIRLVSGEREEEEA